MIFGIGESIKVMTWYHYLNYRIYSYYRRKDTMPVFFAFLVTTTLVTLNIFSVGGLGGFLFESLHRFILSLSKYWMLGLYTLIALINYIVLYRANYYENVFASIDRNRDNYRRWDKSITVYIIISVLLLLCVLVMADLRNHGRI